MCLEGGGVAGAIHMVHSRTVFVVLVVLGELGLCQTLLFSATLTQSSVKLQQAAMEDLHVFQVCVLCVCVCVCVCVCGGGG